MTTNTERAINVSAKNVFDVLRLIVMTDHPVGVLEISRVLSLPPSSVHRALVSLEESHFASRGLDMSKYIPGPMIHHLLRAMLNRYLVRHEAYDYLNQIAEVSGQTTSLFVKLGWYTLLIAAVEGFDEVCHARSAGEVMLLSDTPAGISILSQMENSELVAYRQFIADKVPESSAVAQSPELEKLIEYTRNNGFLDMDIDKPERRRAIAFPILSENKSALMCIGISGPIPADAKAKQTQPNEGILASINQLEKKLQLVLAEHALPFSNINPDQIILNAHMSRI